MRIPFARRVVFHRAASCFASLTGQRLVRIQPAKETWGNF